MKLFQKENPKPKSEKEPKGNVASDSKGKEKLFNEEPIFDNSEDEELDEHEMKRRNERAAQLNEHQRIICEAEEKEKAEREAQVTAEIRKLLFPVWNLKRIQSEVVDMSSHYWLEPIVPFDLQNT